MAPASPPLVFDRTFAPSVGKLEPVAPGIARVTAPNASAYTFTGTNTFLLGVNRVFLLDPGPDDPAHLDALARAIEGRPVEAVLLTHTHRDHSALARAASVRFSAPIWFAGRHRRSRPLRFLEIDPLSRACDWSLVPDRVLGDGEALALDDLILRVVTTPGHCANHAGFGVEGTPYFLSGDHVMGWNSTLVAVPDGSMRDYLASLAKLDALPYTTYLPAHGGAIADGPGQARALIHHRQARNAQVVDLVSHKPKTLGALLDAIYPSMKGRNRFAARLTLAAHVEYLAETGAVRIRYGLTGREIARA